MMSALSVVTTTSVFVVSFLLQVYYFPQIFGRVKFTYFGAKSVSFSTQFTRSCKVLQPGR